MVTFWVVLAALCLAVGMLSLLGPRGYGARHGQEAPTDKLHEPLTTMLRSDVDEPERAWVNKIEGERSIIFEVWVAPGDLGKVMGRHGRFANAIRTLVRAAGTKERKSIWIDISRAGEPGAGSLRRDLGRWFRWVTWISLIGFVVAAVAAVATACR